jgi:hypothetical protein
MLIFGEYSVYVGKILDIEAGLLLLTLLSELKGARDL